MQTNSRNARSFTFIELLVTMALVAILASIAYPVFITIMERARKTQAKNDLTQIATTVNAYYTDYGKYPVNVPAGNTTDAYFGSGTLPPGATSYGTNDVLFDVLRNNTSPSGPNLATVMLLNPRQIVFIQPPTANAARSGIDPTTGVWYDPWGSPYNVAIDTNYNNVSTAPAYTDLQANYATASNGDVGVNGGVISWAFGKNGALGGGPPPPPPPPFTSERGTAGNFSGSSDVISWQ